MSRASLNSKRVTIQALIDVELTALVGAGPHAGQTVAAADAADFRVVAPKPGARVLPQATAEFDPWWPL